jgi:hypothetical protein
MKGRMRTISIAPMLLMAACLDPYDVPSQASAESGFLVIDGFLDGSRQIGTVQLSRSLLLGQLAKGTAEQQAKVVVETGGDSFALEETPGGVYKADGLDLNTTDTYKLHVVTKDGNEYSSDEITLRKSPALDSVVWRVEDEGIRFYVNGHDDTNGTWYYHYVFTETWEYEVPYFSNYRMSSEGYPVKRKPSERVKTCWTSSGETRILIQSTKRFGRDVVNMFPISFINKGSRVLALNYSIAVQQRAIGPEEFEFLDLIRKTTENVGGLFDPIPSRVLGNLHNDNNDEDVVLGYFTGGFPQEKRIFLSVKDLPESLKVVDRLDYNCSVSTISLSQGVTTTDILLELVDPLARVYTTSSSNCGDCTSLGGTNVRPNYWPQ